jgi:hypothetical protein
VKRSNARTQLHPENIDKFINNVPYVKLYEKGVVDYCLGDNYEEAGKVIRTLIRLKEEGALV